MGIRAIKFKIIVPRDDKPESIQKRKALFATHKFVNQAVRHYEKLLLEMRQQDVCTGIDQDQNDIIEPAQAWKDELKKRLRKNGVSDHNIPEALELLEKLYSLLVRSHTEKGKGSAQDGRNFHSALVSAATSAGNADRELMAAFAQLLRDHEQPDQDWQKGASQILRNDQSLLNRTGRQPRWLEQYKSNDPRWAESLFDDLKKKRDQGSGEIVKRLQDLKALPISKPFGEGRIKKDSRGDLTTFERMALAHAIGALNSWESWGHLVRAQYKARKQKVDEWHQKYDNSHQKALDHIRHWEKERERHLADISAGLGGSTNSYRLTLRELRGWDRLREWLKKNPTAGADERLSYCRELQTRLGGRFGGAEALQWLAAREQAWLAESERDLVTDIAVMNSLESRLSATRQHPTFTLADEVAHPRYAEFDPPNNSNQPNFDICAENGLLRLSLNLLSPCCDDEMLVQKNFSFFLAPSGQAVGATIERNGKQRILVRTSQDGLDTLRGAIGGSALIFERRHIEHTAPAAGSLGGVFFKMSVETGADHVDIQKQRTSWRIWFQTSPIQRGKPKSSTPPARKVRILSVDLGLRHAACVAVNEVDPAKTAGGVVQNIPCFRHERSAVLGLPGENPSRKERARRRELDERLAEISNKLSALTKLAHMCRADVSERQEILGQSPSGPRGAGLSLLLSSDDRQDLLSHASDSDDEWKRVSFSMYQKAERALGEDIHRWRKLDRAQKTLAAVGGKSAWAVEHLTRALQILLRWHRHQPPWIRNVRRFDREKFGSISSRLREHINRIKEDRAKTTADLIVQAARGLVRERGRWQKKFDPVDIIVMEDLNRYRVRTDRPRYENRQLMRWTHRKVRELVEMQAEEYGISVGDTSAICSSKFDSGKLAPGVRCEMATRETVERLRYAEPSRIKDELKDAGVDPARVEAGDLLPTGAGEILAYFDNESLRLKNADINAAQNIGRFFIEGHSVPFRVSVQKLADDTGRTLYINANLGKRAQGALGGSVIVFEPAVANQTCFKCRTFSNVRQAEKALGIARPQGGPEEDTDAELDDADMELEAEIQAIFERLGDRVTLFRDPTGRLFNGQWVEAKVFWHSLKMQVIKALRQAGKLHG